MTRQQKITLAQVVEAQNSARRRALDLALEAIKCKSLNEYNDLLARGVKASHDAEIWGLVVKTLRAHYGLAAL